MELLIVSAGITVLALSSLAFVVSLYFKDASFADVVWGLYFVNIAIDLLIQNSQRTGLQDIDVALVGIWGLRLTWHIARRRAGKPEDWRYAAWRKQWGSGFNQRSLLQNFWLQAILALVISASTIVAAHATHAQAKLHLWQAIPLLIWVIGFLFEAIGDLQLSRFIRNRSGKDKVMQSGLWRFSRHPNYFGEVTQWWALWLLVVSLPYGWVALISPLTITLLILFVSGVPLLERKYKSNPEFQKYARHTSVFLPLPRKN
jgi:steroid 5-alpha reductase family enzyme